jgi:aspartate racemase
VDEKVVGVIGGMGPEASALFYQRLTEATAADRDQEHLHVIIDSYSKVPDRTESIREGSSATLDAIVVSARRLQVMGAQILAMPCNSAHYWYQEISISVDIPLINMIEEVFRTVVNKGLNRAGLLATNGTVAAGVYSKAASDVELILPDKDMQEKVHGAIYSIKGAAGQELLDIQADLLAAAEELKERGAEGIILGCTEIPIVINQNDVRDLPVFDSTQVLVEATLREALTDKQ